MMRALVMDFTDDKNAWNVNDEYMFGKSLLINPVTNPMYTKAGSIEGRDTVKTEDFSLVKSKQTYLPKGASWYDFWTGEKFEGGQKVSKQTPLDIIPVYVRAGSILPFGPKVQYAAEKKWDDLEIVVYPGASGDFTLYEDENDNYNYEKGKYSEIKFHWDDKKHTLTIAERTGSFDGMIGDRKFNIVVAPAAGDAEGSKAVKSVPYNGKGISVTL
jgi:alpha-D-xyloside xylohydrolase